MPMRYLCVPVRRYLIILPTGKMTPALADRESLVAFFFPPLADILFLGQWWIDSSKKKRRHHSYYKSVVCSHKTFNQNKLKHIDLDSIFIFKKFSPAIHFFFIYQQNWHLSEKSENKQDTGVQCYVKCAVNLIICFLYLLPVLLYCSSWVTVV